MSTTIDPRTTLSQELMIREAVQAKHTARRAQAEEKVLAEMEPPPPPPPPSPRVPIAGVLLDSLA